MIMIIKDDDNNNNGEDISTVITLNLQLTEIYYYDGKWFRTIMVGVDYEAGDDNNEMK